MTQNPRDLRRKKACVIGAGPNGLAAAIVLAQAGLQVEIFEAEAQPGGAARTMELTLPGFHHDFGSAVHPMAVGSPFFSTLGLQDYGLQWIHSPAPLAHPLDDGTAVMLERDLHEAELALARRRQNVAGNYAAAERAVAAIFERNSAAHDDLAASSISAGEVC